MPTVLKYMQQKPRDITQCEFSSEALYFLNKLRWMSMRCRSSVYIDVFEACRLLIQNDGALSEHFIDALLRTMRQGLKKSPIFYKVNAKELSFDETWLLRALSQAKSQDGASVHFLVNSRISQSYRRSMIFLIRSVSEQISRV